MSADQKRFLQVRTTAAGAKPGGTVKFGSKDFAALHQAQLNRIGKAGVTVEVIEGISGMNASGVIVDELSKFTKDEIAKAFGVPSRFF